MREAAVTMIEVTRAEQLEKRCREAMAWRAGIKGPGTHGARADELGYVDVLLDDWLDETKTAPE